jgi:PEGA domain
MRALLFGLGAAALGCVLAGAAARAGSPSAALYVTTLPSGADVWIDGTYVGHTPVLIDALAGGKHTLTLTRSGWAERDVEVETTAGLTTMSSLRLTQVQHGGTAHALAGTASFDGVAPDARITVDGSTPAHGPREVVSLAAGTHVAVIATHDGKSTHTFTVYPQTLTHVVLSRPASEDPKSAVVAPAEEFLPSDAYHVDGKKVTLNYGGHVVVAKIGVPAVRYDGVPLAFDAAPSLIGGRLYLPLALLVKLTR